MSNLLFQQRIGYLGDLTQFYRSTLDDYQLGTLLSSEPILQGYEDFNVKVKTTTGIYVFKIMSQGRTDEEIANYVNNVTIAISGGISHPKIYQSPQGFLYQKTIGTKKIQLVVMDFIDGQDFFKLKLKPSSSEKIFLISQAAKMSQINHHPKYFYDSWAIPNFLREFLNVKDKLEGDDLKYLEPLVALFPKLEIDKLPHAFVHGDIIATNVIKSTKGKLFIIDFGAANYYPRIQELAVLLCDLLFADDKEKYLQNYNQVLEIYQKEVSLNKKELELLPVFIKLAHAMHIVPATREKAKGNALPENDFWLKSGQMGLRLATEIWG